MDLDICYKGVIHNKLMSDTGINFLGHGRDQDIINNFIYIYIYIYIYNEKFKSWTFIPGMKGMNVNLKLY